LEAARRKGFVYSQRAKKILEGVPSGSQLRGVGECGNRHPLSHYKSKGLFFMADGHESSGGNGVSLPSCLIIFSAYERVGEV